MMRFRAQTPSGHPAIGLGLSKENVRRLVEGDPIMVSGVSVGVPTIDHVLIFYGETEQAMYDAFKTFLDENTVVHLDPKLEITR